MEGGGGRNRDSNGNVSSLAFVARVLALISRIVVSQRRGGYIGFVFFCFFFFELIVAQRGIPWAANW